MGGFLDVRVAVLAGKPRLRPLETRRHGIAQRPAHLLLGRFRARTERQAGEGEVDQPGRQQASRTGVGIRSAACAPSKGA